MTIKHLLVQRLSPNIIISHYRDRGAAKKCNKALYLNLIQQSGGAVQMWSCAETDNWILPLVDGFQPFPARKRRILTCIHVNCVFVWVLWLVCRVQASRSCYIVWCLHLCPFPVLQRSMETTGCSVFKSLVCHLNEAFRAKIKKNSTWKYHNVLNISSHSTGMF